MMRDDDGDCAAHDEETTEGKDDNIYSDETLTQRMLSMDWL